MDGDDAGGQLAAASASPHAEEAIAAVRDDAYGRHRTPSDDEDCDDLYGDVNVGFGFLPLLPLSTSPSPTTPPKTPSPGCLIPSPTPSPSPPPHRAPAPEPLPQREPEPRPKPATPPHQPPRPPPPPPTPAPPRHHAAPQRARGGGASYSSPPGGTALYISELHWWTTDAEVEAALELAPRGVAAALRGLHFYGDKHTGKSRGICRADFLDAGAAASAAATLHGRAFHGRHCVASLARPPGLHRLGDDSDSCAEAARAPNHARGTGNGGRSASNAATVRGNVGPASGDRPILAPPPLPMVPQPCPGPPFGGMMGGVGGYGGFQSMGQYNAGVGTGMLPSAMAPHVNSSFLAAGGMAMRGPGVWPAQGMVGGLWGAQQGWNFRGCQMPWQQLAAPSQHHQAQQQYGNRDYEKGRGRKQERQDGRSEERGNGNDGYPNRMQSDRDGGDWYKEHDHEKKGRHRERVLEKDREQERQWNERGRHGGGKRRHQEYTERSDFDRKARARSRSQSRDDCGDDHPRRRR